MSGKKRIKFEYLPHATSTIFDLHFDLLGDFSRPPTRVEVEGDPGKKKFIVRAYQLQALTGIALCNQPPEKVESASQQLREWPRGRKPEPL